jgi:site-specific recombinase
MSEEVTEPHAVAEILFDGVTDIHISDAVFRCTLFSRHRSHGRTQRVVVARLAAPVSELPDIVQKFVIVLTEAARTIVKPVLS